MVDMEAAGGLATGGLIAGAIEKPTGHAGEDHVGTCSDCGEPTTGNFCANCGQPTHVHRSLLHLGEEVLHGVMHFDARIWRTLPLLVLNPGRLTREWVEGKRTRYVSPLAIFLFTIFLMFFALSFAGEWAPAPTESLDDQIAATETVLVELRQSLAEAEAQVAAGEPGAEAVRMAMQTSVERTEGQLQALQESKSAGPRTDGLTPGSWQANMADTVHGENFHVGIGDKKMQEKIRHKLGNPDLAVYKFQQTTYKFAWLLVPFSIPFMWLLFVWKRGFTLYDHGVFVLYSLTFMSILFLVLGVLGRMNGWFAGVLGTIGTFAVPVHMFAQLKGAYSLSIWSALWRTAFLLFFCLFASTLFVVAVFYLGFGV
ncbi:DUF3667 domain-containing protein [Brevundimonas sp.]